MYLLCILHISRNKIKLIDLKNQNKIRKHFEVSHQQCCPTINNRNLFVNTLSNEISQRIYVEYSPRAFHAQQYKNKLLIWPPESVFDYIR